MNLSAYKNACLMTQRETWLKAGDFDFDLSKTGFGKPVCSYRDATIMGKVQGGEVHLYINQRW